MNKIHATLLILGMVACGEIPNLYQPKNGTNGINGTNGYNALVKIDTYDSNLSLCPSDSGLTVSTGLDMNRNGILDSNEIKQMTVVCNGLNGKQGIQGPQGNPGIQGSSGVDGNDGSQGPAGQDGNNGAPGVQGQTGATGADGNEGSVGPQGVQGQQGIQGTPGADGNVGPQGLRGQDGNSATPDPFNIVNVINPCNKTGQNTEVLLQLENGEIIAHYDDGSQQFLTIVNPGSYVTTDDSTPCYFSVTSDGNITYP